MKIETLCSEASITAVNESNTTFYFIRFGIATMKVEYIVNTYAESNGFPIRFEIIKHIGVNTFKLLEKATGFFTFFANSTIIVIEVKSKWVIWNDKTKWNSWQSIQSWIYFCIMIQRTLQIHRMRAGMDSWMRFYQV